MNCYKFTTKKSLTASRLEYLESTGKFDNPQKLG